ncbi:MAG: hypothetical protein GX951_03200 [Mollicutes bacterium]|nr:hypothetical protein [Mollicutes bacterium]
MFLLTLEETKEFIASTTIDINISIYRIFSSAYEVFFRLNSNRIIYSIEYREIYNKVYTLLSVLVLFVIAYNILSIIINPERNKGGFAVQKLITRVILVLITIVLTPTIFNFAFKLQDAVVNDGFFNRLFSFKTSDEDSEGPDVTVYGKYIAGDVFGSFFYPEGDYEDSQIPAESENVEKYKDNNNVEHLCTLNGEEVCTLYHAKEYARNGGLTVFRSFARNINNPTINRVEFAWIVSLIAGLFLLYVMVSYCVSFIIRVIKLAIYEIISPIVLAVSITPKNDNILNRWIKAVIKTYVSMFIYIFIMYLSMYLYRLISNITGPLICDTTNCSSGIRSFSYCFFVLGVFGFMKVAPKAIDSLLNLNEPISLGLIDNLKEAHKEHKIKLSQPQVNAQTDPKSFRNVKLQNIENKTRSIARNVGSIASGRAAGMRKNAVASAYTGRGAYDRLKGKGSKDSYSGGASKAPQTSQTSSVKTTNVSTTMQRPSIDSIKTPSESVNVSKIDFKSQSKNLNMYIDDIIENKFDEHNKNKTINYEKNEHDAEVNKLKKVQEEGYTTAKNDDKKNGS